MKIPQTILLLVFLFSAAWPTAGGEMILRENYSPRIRTFDSGEQEIEVKQVLPAPTNGIFYPMFGPFPPTPFPPNPQLKLPVYFWSEGTFLFDDENLDYNALRTSGIPLFNTGNISLETSKFQTAADGPPLPGGDGGSSTNVWPTNSFPDAFSYTNGELYLDIYSHDSNWMTLKIVNTIENNFYEIFTKTNLSETNWTLDQGLIGQSNITIANPISVVGKTNLFFRARNSGLDEDGDGLPDWWEMEKGFDPALADTGNTGTSDGYKDADGDGWSNLHEYENGTSPVFFDTPPAVENVQVFFNGAGNNVINWTAPAVEPDSFTIQRSTGSGWQTIATVNGDLSSFADTNHIDAGFYAVSANYANGSSASVSAINIGNVDPLLTLPATVSSGMGGRLFLLTAPPSMSVTGLVVIAKKYASAHPKDGMYLVTSQVPYTTYYGITNNNNGIVDATSLQGIPLQLDASFVPPYGSYQFTIYPVASNGFAGTPLQTSGYADATPFLDARQHMLDNLDFTLRSATATEPFDFYFGNAAYLDGEANDYGIYPNYTVAGFSWKNFGYRLFTSDGFDALQPFEDGSVLRAFCYVSNRFDSLGNPFDAGYGGLTTQKRLMKNWTNYFSSLAYVQSGSTNLPPPQLDATNAQYIFYGPGTDGFDLPELGLTWNETLQGWNMDSDARNVYGLPILFVRGIKQTSLPQTLAINTVQAGGFLPAFSTTNQGNGWFYVETETPVYERIGSHTIQGLWNRSGPGLPGWDGVDQTNALIANVGEQTHFYTWAKLGIVNGYTNATAYLEHYFDKAYKTTTNGTITANETGILSEYGDFFPTEPGTVALITKPDFATGQSVTSTVYAISVNLDVNHDGVIETAFSGSDYTSADRPFRFWLNNDNDGTGVGEDINTEGKKPDYIYQGIRSERNLEDFARLWICGMPTIPAGYTVSLSWNTVGGNATPAINLYTASEADGGIGYLTNAAIADAQIANDGGNLPYTSSFGLGVSIATITNGMPFVFPANVFNSAQNRHFLFEGAGIGKGELVLTIAQGTNTIARTSAFIEIKNVKDMYERVRIDNVTDEVPNSRVSTFQEDETLPATASEAKQLIVFVHGWRMGQWDYYSFSESMFKRLYWQGYRGRFVALRWPTLSKDDYKLPLADFTSYNKSEFRAWQSGRAVSAYLTKLRQRFPDYSINVCSHSMGGVVMAQALKQQLAGSFQDIDNYVLMQVAVPAHCYDTNLANYAPFTSAEVNSPTPDVYRGYPGAINTAVRQQIVNFYNTNDFALATGTFPLIGQVHWEHNEISYKPDFGYSSDGTNGFKNGVTVTDPRQNMAFVARPRSKAVGAQPGVGGVINITGQIDLKANFGFDTDKSEHSAQFNWNIQRANGFYSQLLSTLFPQQP